MPMPGLLVAQFNRAKVATVPKIIAYAETEEIELERGDFTVDEDGYVSLDGMPPGEWLQAMLMD